MGERGWVADTTQRGEGAKEGAGRAWATEAGAEACEQRGRDRQDALAWVPE